MAVVAELPRTSLDKIEEDESKKIRHIRTSVTIKTCLPRICSKNNFDQDGSGGGEVDDCNSDDNLSEAGKEEKGKRK